MALNVNQIQKLTQLSEILKNMDDGQAWAIISNLDDNTQFDREALEFIGKRIIKASSIIPELSKNEINILLKPLNDDELSTLLHSCDDNCKKILSQTINKSRHDTALSFKSNVKPQDVTDLIIDSLLREIANGKIAYTGIAVKLLTLPCRPSEPAKSKGKIFFQTLNPIINSGDGIKILIHDLSRINSAMRIYLQCDKERFFSKNSLYTTVTLDKNGFYYGEIFPDAFSISATVWLEIPGKGEIARTVFKSSDSKATFQIGINDISKESDLNKQIDFSLTSKFSSYSGKAMVHLYCAYCGSPIVSGFSDCKDGNGSFSYRESDAIALHNRDYYFHIAVEGRQSGTRINCFNFEKDKSILHKTENNREADSPIEIDLPIDGIATIFYHVTSSKIVNSELQNLIYQGNLKIEGVHKNSKNRASTPFELATIRDDLLILSQNRHEFFCNMQTITEGEIFSYVHSGIDSIKDLHFTFYKIDEFGITPFFSYLSSIERKAIIKPNYPLYLEQGETLAMPIAYNLPEKGRLLINDKDILEKDIQGFGSVNLNINGTDEISISLLVNNKTYQFGNLNSKREIHSKKRSYDMNSFEYIPKGTILEPTENTTFELFPTPSSIYQEILLDCLLTYPWGCGEQTAAQLSGFCILINSKKIRDIKNPIIIHLNTGIHHLLSFKNETGYYSIFGTDHSPSATTLVYKNLSPALALKTKISMLIPKLFKIINEIELILNIDKKENSTQKPAKDIEKNIYSLDSPIPLLTEQFVFEKDGKLQMKEDQFFSTSAYFSEIATWLIETDETSMKIFDKEIKEKNTLKRNLLYTILEKLHFVNPIIEKKTINVSKILNDPLEMVLKAIHISSLATSFPSTIEMISFMHLLDEISKKTENYKYTRDNEIFTVDSKTKIEKPIKIESDFTFVKVKHQIIYKEIHQNVFHKKPDFTLSSKKIKKGKTLKITTKYSNSNYIIYNFLYPPCLIPVPNSNSLIEDQTLKLHSNYDGDIIFKGDNRGKGMLKILVENMHDPGQTYIVDCGWVEVI